MRRHVAGLGLLTLLLASSAGARDEDRSAELYKKGIEELAARKFSNAAASFAKASRLQPANADYLFAHAFALDRAGSRGAREAYHAFLNKVASGPKVEAAKARVSELPVQGPGVPAAAGMTPVPHLSPRFDCGRYNPQAYLMTESPHGAQWSGRIDEWLGFDGSKELNFDDSISGRVEYHARCSSGVRPDLSARVEFKLVGTIKTVCPRPRARVAASLNPGWQANLSLPGFELTRWVISGTVRALRPELNASCQLKLGPETWVLQAMNGWPQNVAWRVEGGPVSVELSCIGFHVGCNGRAFLGSEEVEVILEAREATGP